MSKANSIDVLLQQCFLSFAMVDDSIKEFNESNTQALMCNNNAKGKDNTDQANNDNFNSKSRTNNNDSIFRQKTISGINKQKYTNDHSNKTNQSLYYHQKPNSNINKANKSTINENSYCQNSINNYCANKVKSQNTSTKIACNQSQSFKSNNSNNKEKHRNNSRNKADLALQSSLTKDRSCSKHKPSLTKSVVFESTSIYSPYHSKSSFEKDKQKDVSKFVNLYWKELLRLKDRKENIANMQSAYEISKELEIHKHCTFVPVLSKNTESSTNRNKISIASNFLRKSRDFANKREKKLNKAKLLSQRENDKECTYHPSINNCIRQNDEKRIMAQVPFINDYANAIKKYRESKSKSRDKNDDSNNSSSFNVSNRKFISSKECFRRKIQKTKRNLAYYHSQSLKAINDSRSVLMIEDFFSN